MVDLLHSIFII